MNDKCFEITKNHPSISNAAAYSIYHPNNFKNDIL